MRKSITPERIMSVYVVRAFVRLREMLASNKEPAHRFAQLETRLDKKLSIHDEAIAAIVPVAPTRNAGA
jgi:hypothetical protein